MYVKYLEKSALCRLRLTFPIIIPLPTDYHWSSIFVVILGLKFDFSTLMLLGWRQVGHQACKNLAVATKVREIRRI